MFDDAIPDVLHNDREFVAADVRMGIDKDRRIGSESHELMEHLTYVSPL